MLSFYGKLSTQLYNIDKPIGRSFGDVEFYRRRLQGCKGSILEPAVGNGRILIPLLEAGLKVDGIDCSSEMLAACHSNCVTRGHSPKLAEDDMKSFSLAERYEAIIIPTGSFLLLHNRNESLKALKNFYTHLQVGGRLLVDIFLQTDFQVGKTTTRTWKTGENELITLEEKLFEVNWLNQYTVTHNRYEKWKDGVLIQTELESFPLRWYGVEEFSLILEKLGFSNIVISADYEYGKYPTNTSQTITFEAYRSE